MAKLGIDIGDKHEAVFTRDRPQFISVREGPAQVSLYGDWEELPHGTVLSGRLIVRDRVYGRLTSATTPKGDSFPVCLEVYDVQDGERGMARESGNDSPSNARIFTSERVRAVSEFE
ncbi:hypothetical protein HRD49_20930 [Corallococcus exiguus]|uniref:hypothetical protein n=1 Tax=Corallococcus exiguus TaxID=83462 RepID=UPI00155FD468|nr:hypothetical protein [Corallococcus exiguus]NRD64222.1 hypothetical protein [Corallococcus exiguus]